VDKAVGAEGMDKVVQAANLLDLAWKERALER